MEQFGPYRLERLIGRGGMGEVHRATDTRKDRTVAVKRLIGPHVDDPVFRERFRRESRLAARISSPHVVPIHDFGEIDGRLYIEMALIRGTDLARTIDDAGPLAPDRAVGICAQIAEALDAAHADGLVHRDVKPSNVLVSDSPRDFAYLADFGIVGSVGAAGATLTSSGVTLGTLDYLAPERLTGAGDERADIYALACVLFQMLTAHRPFRVDAIPALLYAHLTTPPPLPSTLVPALPPALDAVVVRGMAKDPADRYPSAGLLAAAARDALDPGPDGMAPSPRPHRTDEGVDIVRRPARHRLGGTTDVSVRAGAAARRPRFRLRTSVLVVGGLLLTAGLSGAAAVPRDRSGGDRPPTSAAATDRAAVRCAAPAPTPGAAPAVAGHVTIDDGAGSVVISPDGCRAYVLGNGAVHVVDTASRTVTKDIPVGAFGITLAMTPDGRRVYVTKNQSNLVPVIDTATDAVVATVRLDGQSTVMAATPDGRRVLIAGDAGGVSVVDVASNTVESTMFVEGFPQGLAVSPDGRRLYVSDDSAGKVMLLDLATGRTAAFASIPTGSSSPDAIAVDPLGRRVYVDEDVAGSLSIFDAATGAVVGAIPVGRSSGGIAFTPDGRRLCVLNQEAGTLAVVDVARSVVTSSVPVGGAPRGVVVSPDGRTAYVGDNGGTTLTVVDLGA